MMTPLFGTMMDPVPAQVAGWIASCAFMLFFLNQGKKFVGGLKDKPASSEVRAEALERFATKVELAAMMAKRDEDVKYQAGSRKGIYEKIEAVREEMAEMERRLNAADESRTEGVHDRVNQILEAVGELRGEMKRIANGK